MHTEEMKWKRDKTLKLGGVEEKEAYRKNNITIFKDNKNGEHR